jgi:hypothetical protein
MPRPFRSPLFDAGMTSLECTPETYRRPQPRRRVEPPYEQIGTVMKEDVLRGRPYRATACGRPMRRAPADREVAVVPINGRLCLILLKETS